MNSFGLPDPQKPVDLSDPRFRADALDRLVHAHTRMHELVRSANTWWETHAPRVFLRVDADDPTWVEVVMVSESEPPASRWQLQANDVVQSLRTALDSFCRKLAEAEVGWAKSDVQFPTFADEAGWDGWKLKSRLPEQARERIREMQPFTTGRETLTHLRMLSNLDKHEFNVRAEIGLGDSRVKFTHEIEGAPMEKDIKDVAVGYVPKVNGKDGTLLLSSAEQVISRLHTGYPVVGELHLEEAHLEFAPHLAYGDTEAPLFPALRAMIIETEWAIAYIAGLHRSTTKGPSSSLVPDVAFE